MCVGHPRVIITTTRGYTKKNGAPNCAAAGAAHYVYTKIRGIMGVQASLEADDESVEFDDEWLPTKRSFKSSSAFDLADF